MPTLRRLEKQVKCAVRPHTLIAQLRQRPIEVVPVRLVDRQIRRLPGALRRHQLEHRRHVDIPQHTARARDRGQQPVVLRNLLRHGQIAHALARERERLAERRAVDRVGIEIRNKRDFHAAVDQCAVRLVGHDVDRVSVFRCLPAQQRRQRFQPAPLQYHAGRIVRRIQQHQRRPRRERRLHRRKVDLERLGVGWRFHQPAAHGLHIHAVFRKIRRQRHGLLTRPDQRRADDRQRRARARRHEDVLRAVRCPERLRKLLRHCLPHRVKARRGRIPVQHLRRHGIQQVPDAPRHAVRRFHARIADRKIEYVLRADHSSPRLAIGSDLPDAAALASPIDHFL